MIGQTVYVFDINRRKYPPSKPGGYSSSPIWEYHWWPQKIVGENRVSWITSVGLKIPKNPDLRKHDARRGLAFSWEEVMFLKWRQEVASKVGRAIYNSSDEQFAAVADSLGFEMPEFSNTPPGDL